MYQQIYPKNVLKFSYRYFGGKNTNILLSFAVNQSIDLNNVIQDPERPGALNYFWKFKIKLEY